MNTRDERRAQERQRIANITERSRERGSTPEPLYLVSAEAITTVPAGEIWAAITRGEVDNLSPLGDPVTVDQTEVLAWAVEYLTAAYAVLFPEDSEP